MSRAIAHRFAVSGKLVALSPVHVGSARAGVDVDLPLAMNGGGAFYIPGTGLAGPLRDWFHSAFGEIAARALWGWTPERGRNDDSGHASFLTIEDAVVEGVSRPEIRDGVGIDRFSGRAAKGIKYDREVLPEGTGFTFDLTYEEPLDGVDDAQTVETRQRLHALLAALVAGDVRLGAAQTRGLGRVKLEACRVTRLDLSSRAGILAMLADDARIRSGGLEVLLGDKAPLVHAGRARLKIEIAWRPIGPIMVKSAAEGIDIDILPLVSQSGKKLAQVLPGSGIKGVLRSHAERILATLQGQALAQDSDFLDQVRRCHLAETLFGAANVQRTGRAGLQDSQEKASGVEDRTPLPGRGAVGVEDCFAEQRIASATWKKLLGGGANAGGTVSTRQFLAGTEWSTFVPATHVAIDRWTGGAAEGFLYSVLEPWLTTWPGITMSLDPGRLAPGIDEPVESTVTGLAAVALLVLTLRELVKQRLPLGFGGNRGLGAIEVTRITFTLTGSFRGADDGGFLKDLEAGLTPVDGLVLTPDGFNDRTKVSALEEAWQRYLETPRPGETPDPRSESTQR